MSEARRYAYNYAIIDPVDNMCIQVTTTTLEVDTNENPDYIVIPTYNEEYLCKYYSYEIQKWYEDETCMIEWIPS